jgi:hypothetical protein
MRLRVINSLTLFTAIFIFWGIDSFLFYNSDLHFIDSEYSVLSASKSNVDYIFAEIEEWEEDAIFSFSEIIRFSLFVNLKIINLIPISFVIFSFLIQAHLLNLPPPSTLKK